MLLRCLAVAAFSLWLIPSLSMAEDKNTAEAKVFVDNFLQKTFAVLDKDVVTEQLIGRAEDILSDGIDYHWVGTFVMGNVFVVANSHQKEALIESYRKYIVYGYLPLVMRYKQVHYTTKTVQYVGNDSYVVSVDLNCRNCNGRPINIIYRVRWRDGKFGIYDMVIEGNSFLSSQRTAFREMAGQMSSVDAIIAAIDKKSMLMRRNVIGRKVH